MKRFDLNWLIESIPEGFWSALCQIVSGECLFNTFKCFNTSISLGVVCSLPWSSGKTFAANAGGRGFESHRGQNLFSQFYRVECEELFCKTNIKLKVLKLNKTKFNSKP